MVSAIRATPDHDPEATDHASRKFSFGDEGDLSWFFSIGASTFERSTFGEIVERLRQFSGDDQGRRIPTPATKEREAWDFMQGQCPHPALVMSQELADEIRSLIDWEELDPRITAQPIGTGESGGEHGYSPNHIALMRFAVVSRRLSQIRESHRRALERYFGLEGARWASTHLGQIMILFPETREGRRLLERFGQAENGSPPERIYAVWKKNTGVKSAECSGLIRHAEGQAYELLNAAKVAYAETL